MDRRKFLSVVPSTALIPSALLVSKPSKLLELMIPELEVMCKMSIDGKMWFFDDPPMMRQGRWGIYGWTEIDKYNCKGMAIDWLMDEHWQRPHDLLQELGNYLGHYRITHHVRKTSGHFKAGDINGIEITII